jgi:hypothetical protein
MIHNNRFRTNRFKVIRSHVLIVMASIAHPDEPDREIDVDVIDSESHHGEYLKVEATSDEISLSDESGNQPWVEASEVSGE